jgi:hypothetical protein
MEKTMRLTPSFLAFLAAATDVSGSASTSGDNADPKPTLADSSDDQQVTGNDVFVEETGNDSTAVAMQSDA